MKQMSPSDQLRHAKTFDETLAILETVRKTCGKDQGRWAAVAMIHGAVFFLGRHEPRRETYHWLQRICDDLVLNRDEW